MSTKKVIASYAVELTEDENGYRSITVTPQGRLEGCSALHVTETSLGISETVQTLCAALLNTSKDRLQYRC